MHKDPYTYSAICITNYNFWDVDPHGMTHQPKLSHRTNKLCAQPGYQEHPVPSPGTHATAGIQLRSNTQQRHVCVKRCMSTGTLNESYSLSNLMKGKVGDRTPIYHRDVATWGNLLSSGHYIEFQELLPIWGLVRTITGIQ